MEDDSLKIQALWINVATFGSLSDLGKLSTTCKYLNELLSCNAVWKVQWKQLCSKYGLKKKKTKQLDSMYLVPGMYQNLCYRLVGCHKRRECPQQWFVLNPEGEIELFDIAQNLTSFLFFDSTGLNRRAESTWKIRLRSALSTVTSIRQPEKCSSSFLDAVTDHKICGEGRVSDPYSELWPFVKGENDALYNHRIAMLMRKRGKMRENCLSQRSGHECGMPDQFCNLNLLGSGWKLQRRAIDAERFLDTSSRLTGVISYHLDCSIRELLKPGLVRDFSKPAGPICLKAPLQLEQRDSETIQDLFLRVLGYSCVLPFNVAYHVSDNARAETCLVIESYTYHTVITPVIDGVLCSDMVRCKPIGFSHVLDYLVLSLAVQNPALSQIKASSVMLNTNPERMTLALRPSHDLRSAVRPENPNEYAYNSQLGVLHTGSALRLKDSILCVFRGIDSCSRSEFQVLLATEYMYKCLDLVSMVIEILSQFDTYNLRRLVSHIFLVGENTRIGSFRERFEKDLRVRLNELAAIFGGDYAKQQRWPIHCVHAEVEDEPNVLYCDMYTAMDYVFQGPNYL